MKKNFKVKATIAFVAMVTLAGCASGSSNSEQTTYEKIKEDGKIIVATEGIYAPFSYHDDNDKLIGYDVEVAEAVAKELGVGVEFVEGKWDGLIAGLDAKKYDVVANQVGITQEREEKYLFSTPYTYSRGVLVVGSDNNDIKSFADLKGKKAAQATTSNWGQEAEELGAEIVGNDGFDQSVQLVVQKRADGTLNDEVTYLEYMKKQPKTPIKVVAYSDDAQISGLLMRKKDKDFQEAVNKAMKKLEENGTLKKISEKYFGADISVEAEK